MKKLTLSIGLVAAMITANAQDTLCTYFKGKRVLEFDYYKDEILFEVKQKNKFYEINIEYGDVLCLHFSDEENRVRKVITTFWDGEIVKHTLDSKDNVYFSPMGVVKVLVGRPKIKL
tara:strand:- start:116 stop:466 length:351 start_codon:yes stop_codon:yes gene_type:complete